MKCYICGTETIPCKTIIDGKEIPAEKCPICNDDYTTFIDVNYLEDNN